MQLAPMMLWSRESQISGDAVSGIDPFSVRVGVNGVPILPIVKELDEIARRDRIRFSAFRGWQKRNLSLNVSRVLLLLCQSRRPFAGEDVSQLQTALSLSSDREA